MRTAIFFLFIIFTFFSCFKDNDAFKVYNDTKGLTLTITSSHWYLTRKNIGGGNVNLKISGSTNGEMVSIRTYGDGVISDKYIELNPNKNFTLDIVISYTGNTVPTTEFEESTLVKASKGADTLVVTLKSGKLKY